MTWKGTNMKVGFIGIGKLGFPCAVAMAMKGHEVYCYDINQEAQKRLQAGDIDFYEPELKEQYESVKDKMHFCTSIIDPVEKGEIVFNAVQTPHPPELDGSVRFNHVRKDFNYDYLLDSCKAIAHAVNRVDGYRNIVIISTCLPGTMRNEVYPAMQQIVNKKIGSEWGLCYNPFFIAMGTTIRDFLNPEFTLIGQNLDIGDDQKAGEQLAEFYDTIQDSPKLRMTWDSAEATKMFYNTYIGMKIVFANTVMEVCHKSPGADVDTVMNALTKAGDRLISPKYLSGGMGDGGGCHPRDNLALSYLSDKLNLDYNLFDYVMEVREKQTEWLADLIAENMKFNRNIGHVIAVTRQVVILGETYKPETNLTYGSPSILLKNILLERGIQCIMYDPVTQPTLPPDHPSVYLVGTMWPGFKNFSFAADSVVIDPWRMLDESHIPHNIKLVSIGSENEG